MHPAELGITQTEYFRLQLLPERDVLLLVFSHLEEPVGRFSLQQTVTAIGASAVLMNTVPRSYYADGIPGLGDGIDATAAALRRIVAAVRPRAVVTLGISMGGYGALLFGALLPADRILAFSPESRLLLPGSRSRAVLRRRSPPTYLDVLPLLGNALGTELALYFGETELHDVYAAWRLRELPGAHLYSVQGAGHEVGRWFADRGLLRGLVDEYVHQATALEDFPQRGSVLDHGPAIELVMTGNGLLLENKPRQAADALRQAIRLAPGFDLAYQQLGLALTAAGRLREALEAHRCASELAPESTIYRLHFGRALLEAGDIAAAETVLREVAEAEPKWASVHHALGMVAERRGDRVAAEAAFRRAIACDGSNASFHHHLGALQIGEERWREAETSYRRAVEINPLQPSLHAQLGRICFALGQAAAAAECYRQALRLHPGNGEYRRRLEQAVQHPGLPSQQARVAQPEPA